MEIKRGAEAIILLKKDRITKKRIKKGYRIQEIDKEIRRTRTRQEARLLNAVKRTGVKAPKVYSTSEYEIEMEYIKGKLLADHIEKIKNWREVCKKVGEGIKKIHSNNIIHGDLTTSNIILSGEDVYFIDFGLGFTSKKIEDKAVELRVLERALEAKHSKKYEIIFREIIKEYKKDYAEAGTILKKLEKVRGRGRYKQGGKL